MFLEIIDGVERLLEFSRYGGDLDAHRFEDFLLLGLEEGYDRVPRVLPFLTLLEPTVDLVEGTSGVQVAKLISFLLLVDGIPVDPLINYEC